MNTKSRTFRWGAIVLAILIGVTLIAIAGSTLLPSTKSSRLTAEQLEYLKKMAKMAEERTIDAATQPAAPAMRPPGSESDPLIHMYGTKSAMPMPRESFDRMIDQASTDEFPTTAPAEIAIPQKQEPIGDAAP